MHVNLSFREGHPGTWDFRTKAEVVKRLIDEAVAVHSRLCVKVNFVFNSLVLFTVQKDEADLTAVFVVVAVKPDYLDFPNLVFIEKRFIIIETHKRTKKDAKNVTDNEALVLKNEEDFKSLVEPGIVVTMVKSIFFGG